MKTKITTIVLGIFLIGIVSANLITHFGIISGSVEVTAPVFYATSNLSKAGSENYILSLNESMQGDESYVKFEKDTSDENIWFVSEPLGVEEFYDAEFNFDINVCAKNHTSNDTIGQITVELKILDKEGSIRKPVCNDLYINNIPAGKNCYESDYVLRQISCVDKISGIEESDRFVWIISDGDHNIEYRIRTKGETKFEVTAI